MGETNPAFCRSIGKNKGYQGNFSLIFYNNYITSLLSAPTFRNDILFSPWFSSHLICLSRRQLVFHLGLTHWEKKDQTHLARWPWGGGLCRGQPPQSGLWCYFRLVLAGKGRNSGRNAISEIHLQGILDTSSTACCWNLSLSVPVQPTSPGKQSGPHPDFLSYLGNASCGVAGLAWFRHLSLVSSDLQ